MLRSALSPELRPTASRPPLSCWTAAAAEAMTATGKGPERFKDFISIPKRNNYRSLHTTVVGSRGMRIEMQIRTEAMDRVAEEGVAAHWRYKGRAYGFDAAAAEAGGGRDPLNNLRHLVQVLEHGGDVEELVEHAKLEMYLDQVFVFTPKGRLVSLPRGAMPLDFAYGVHTNVGDTTVGAKINGELKPLRTELANGDVVVNGDKMDVTWRLKPGMKWSDGQPLTAQDFAWGWRHSLDPANAVARAARDGFRSSEMFGPDSGHPREGRFRAESHAHWRTRARASSGFHRPE